MTDLSDVLQPVTHAKGLPNAHYTDPATHLIERDRVLFANWAGLCFGKDVAEPGDAMPVEFLGQPLLVVRGRDGDIRVFQNTCRHRGMILVDQKRKLGGAIRCPYHSWCYALTGVLLTTPHVGGPGHNTHEAIDRANLGLVEIRSHVWRDVVFVNIDGMAPDFAQANADLIARWSEFEGKPLIFGGPESAFTFDVACNWKLAVENYCESYHLPWIHPGLNSYSRLEDHYHIEAPGRFSGQGTRVYRPMITESGTRFPDTPGLAEKWDAGAEYVSLFPNVLLGQHRDHAYAIILEPVAQDRTREHVAIYYSDASVVEEDWAEMRQRNSKMWYDVFEEDLFVVEGMQKGRAALQFDGGKFSPAMDGPTHLFHHWVAAQVTGNVQLAT